MAHRAQIATHVIYYRIGALIISAGMWAVIAVIIGKVGKLIG